MPVSARAGDVVRLLEATSPIPLITVLRLPAHVGLWSDALARTHPSNALGSAYGSRNRNSDFASLRNSAANTCENGSYLRTAKIGLLPFSRTITQFLCPNLSEKFSLLFRRERLNDFLKARIATERVPKGQQF